MRVFLVAPTDPPQLVKGLGGVTSSTPETVGADIIYPSYRGFLAVQRKRIDDLVNSIRDGRLARELGLLARSDAAAKVLLVEGTMTFVGGKLFIDRHETSYTRAAIRNLFRSCRYLFGVDVEESWNLEDTVEVVKELAGWLDKDSHVSLFRRPKKEAEWGGPLRGLDAVVWWLQGVSSIGPRTAAEIAAAIPVPRDIVAATESELRAIPGVGPITARKLVEFFAGKV